MLGADIDVIVFRLIHIVAGVMWAGSLFLLIVFVRPSAAAIAPAGAPLMGELLGRRRLVQWLLGFASLTILAGAYLYWKNWDAAGSLGAWLDTGFGLTLTIGAVAAIAAFSIGWFGTRPTIDRMLGLGRRIAEAGPPPPPPELAAEMAEIQGKLSTYGWSALSLLGVAVATMAIARYV